MATSVAEYKYYAREHDPRQHAYRIGLGDELAVHVWRDPELSTEVTVRPDGTVTIPLAGEIRALGKTPDDLRGVIESKLHEFVRETVVTVAVTAVNSYRFSVTGEVAHPGLFAPNQYVTVSQALVMAGGPNRYADTDDIVIIRRDNPKAEPRRIPFDYDALLRGKSPEQDISILSEDTVYVP